MEPIMNKRIILSSLSNIANDLDNNGLFKEANILTNVMKKLAASVYNTDQFWIIDGIVRPVTSHEAQTGSIISQQYINDVYRVLGEYLLMTLQDIMDPEDFNYYFDDSDVTNIFKISDYELEGILAGIFDTYSEKYEDEFSKDDYIKNTITKINSLGKSFFYAMKEPIYYALDNLGWIRINGNNIEMGKRLDDYTKSTIRRAMDEIFGDNATRMSFNIDSSSGYKTLTYDELY
jgi:hypothetical protein